MAEVNRDKLQIIAYDQQHVGHEFIGTGCGGYFGKSYAAQTIVTQSQHKIGPKL